MTISARPEKVDRTNYRRNIFASRQREFQRNVVVTQRQNTETPSARDMQHICIHTYHITNTTQQDIVYIHIHIPTYLQIRQHQGYFVVKGHSPNPGGRRREPKPHGFPAPPPDCNIQTQSSLVL